MIFSGIALPAAFGNEWTTYSLCTRMDGQSGPCGDSLEGIQPVTPVVPEPTVDMPIPKTGDLKVADQAPRDIDFLLESDIGHGISHPPPWETRVSHPPVFGHGVSHPPVFGYGKSHPVKGDYDGNGVVDSADYVLWRKQVGSKGTYEGDMGELPLPKGANLPIVEVDDGSKPQQPIEHDAVIVKMPIPESEDEGLTQLPRGAVMFSETIVSSVSSKEEEKPAPSNEKGKRRNITPWGWSASTNPGVASTAVKEADVPELGLKGQSAGLRPRPWSQRFKK